MQIIYYNRYRQQYTDTRDPAAACGNYVTIARLTQSGVNIEFWEHGRDRLAVSYTNADVINGTVQARREYMAKANNFNLEGGSIYEKHLTAEMFDEIVKAYNLTPKTI